MVAQKFICSSKNRFRAVRRDPSEAQSYPYRMPLYKCRIPSLHFGLMRLLCKFIFRAKFYF